ncbi:MAG TPA: hypothetical protein PK339_01975 [Flavitalea sp.]|nr:hypothetical protein [Flavitalea sp.]
MKKIVTAFALVASITLAGQAQAQQKPDGKYRKTEQTERFKELNLTDAQKAEIKKINEDFKSKMQEINKNDNVTVKEMREKKAALHKERRTAFLNVLTPEQKATLEEKQKQAKERRKTHSRKPAKAGA